MEFKNLGPDNIVDFIVRRKWSLILPVIIISCIAATIAVKIPPVYRTTSTILIKEQEIPEEYVKTSMTTYAEQRIQNINQRVMTSSRLMALIETFDLYPDLRQRKTDDELIAKMSEDIKLTPVNIEVADHRTGREKIATIAFTISYQGKSPTKVQQVVDEITSLFLVEDLQVREQQAGETVTFLEEEKQRLRETLNERETALTEFKENNLASLPEMFRVNVQNLSSTEDAIAREKERVTTLRERESYFEAQMINVEPILANEEEKRLETLELELKDLLSKFSSQYPDVKKLKKEIASLKQVVEAKKKKADGNPDNPVFITLASQLASVRAEIESSKEVIRTLNKKAMELKQDIAATPRVEEIYTSMLADNNNLRTRYNELERKTMAAKVAMGLQSEQKAERFALVEPARLPERPYKPNRLAIVMIGVVLALGAGIGMSSLQEFADSSFRSSDALERATGFPVLVDIPPIITDKDRSRIFTQRLLLFLILAGLILGAIYAFNAQEIGLDMMKAKLMDKFF